MTPPRGWVALALLATACDDSTGTRTGPPASLEIIAGDRQQDTLGATLAESLAVRVRDSRNAPLAGIPVTWNQSLGAGAVVPATSTTGRDGIARAAWVLGTVAGSHSATASVGGVPPVVFTATAVIGAPAGPLTWTVVHRALPGVPFDAIGVAGSSASDVFAVTQGGRVFQYDGFGWVEFIAGPAPGSLLGMWGFAANVIFAAGISATGPSGIVAQYDGSQWRLLYTGNGLGQLSAVHGLARNDLWAVGAHVAHFDGAQWRTMAPPGAPLTAVWAVAPGVAFAGGSDGSLVRLDSVATVVAQGSGAGIRSMWGSSATDLWGGDAVGNVLHWDGTTWTVVTRAMSGAVEALWGFAPDDIWAAGSAFAQYDGTAWRTLPIDEARAQGVIGLWGATPDEVWSVSRSLAIQRYDGTAWDEHWDSPSTFTGIWGSSSRDLWVCGGQGTVQRLSGTGWNTVSLPGWQPCRAITGAPGGDALATALEPFAYRYAGGAWTTVATGLPPLAALWMDGPSFAIGVGASGTIARWDGAAWTAMASGTTQPLGAVWGSSPTNVWAAGTAGTMLHYDGSAWRTVASGTSAAIHALWGADSATVFAAGGGSSGGALLRLGASGWAPMGGAGSEELLALHGRSPREAYAVGRRGTILRWDGTAWQAEASGTTSDLRAVWASPDGDVLAVGFPGLILRGRR